MYNNGNNGYNSFNNGGYNNNYNNQYPQNNYNGNYNNNYQNNQGYNNQNNNYNNFGQYNNTVEDVINILSSLIETANRGELTSDAIENTIIEMENAGLIRIVGKGTNRIAIETVADMRHLVEFNKPCIIKIPYALHKGLNDNFRELALYKGLEEMYNRNPNNNELKYLIDTLPAVSTVFGSNILVAQEKVIPIQMEIGGNSNVTRSDLNISARCTNTILTTYRQHYLKLMETLDKYCIFADLNPLVTPFQFGFKIMNNGSKVLTILDTGYSIFKFSTIIAMQNSGEIKNRHYGIIGRDIDIEKSEAHSTDVKTVYGFKSHSGNIPSNVIHLMNLTISTRGVYLLNSLDINNNNVMDPNNPLYVSDMDYFKEVWFKLRDKVRSIPPHMATSRDADAVQFFQLINGLKSINNI